MHFHLRRWLLASCSPVFCTAIVTADENQRALVEVPAVLTEGSTNTGYVLLAFAPATPLTLDLSASPEGQLILPATVIVPTGETSVGFSFSVVDDAIVTLTRTVTIQAAAAGVLSTPGTMGILENDTPVASLVLPALLPEGTTPTNNATLSLDLAVPVPLTITLSASPPGEITFPAQITLPAGQKQVGFSIRAIDDAKLDGDMLVTVTAAALLIAPTLSHTTVVDNEPRALTLTVPASLREGASGAGSITIGGVLPTDLVVALTSTDSTVLSVPSRVTVPVGRTQASFSVVSSENTARDGTHAITLRAEAAGFPSSIRETVIRDNDPARYHFAPFGDIVGINGDLWLILSALDVEGNELTNSMGPLRLDVVLPDGTLRPATPPSLSLINGKWAGAVWLEAAFATPPLRLRVADASGLAAESAPFDIVRPIGLESLDVIWDGLRNRFYASMKTSSMNGSHSTSIAAIDPTTLKVTATVPTGREPGLLALTSGAEALYTAINNNGSITKINLDTFSVEYSFPIGLGPFSEYLRVEDLSPVPGNPDRLVVSRYRDEKVPRHYGVVVFDKGVMLPATTEIQQISNLIELSADPSIFFGYNAEGPGHAFRRLRVDASGVTSSEVADGLFGDLGIDVRSAGNLAFSSSGIVVDGSLMQRVGTFGFEPGGRGLVCPDPSASKVYFLRRQAAPRTGYDRIEVYDSRTFSLIREARFPSPTSQPGGWIRWGANGLAIRGSKGIGVITGAHLTSDDRPADLVTVTQVSPDVAAMSAPLRFTVSVTNRGPNTATGVLLTTTFSANQSIQNVETTRSAGIVGTAVTVPIGALAPEASESVTITTMPQSATLPTCTASVTAISRDPDLGNNTAQTVVGFGFDAASNAVQAIPLPANNLIYDARRGLFWATIDRMASPPLGRSVVSIDPVNGRLSGPVPIGADPMANSIALSGNGRYLYFGLNDAFEVHRLDLKTLSSTRIPFGGPGTPRRAGDIAALEGDGTSFIATSVEDHFASVYDGLIPRTNVTAVNTVDRLESTGTPGVFIGVNTSPASGILTKLSITPAGVSISEETPDLVAGSNVDIQSAGTLVLTSSGLLIDDTTLALKAELGGTGRPCLDTAYHRAYLLHGSQLHGFDVATGIPFGALPLPVADPGDWAQTCVRWGLDGFGIVGKHGGSAIIYLARWSQAIPAGADLNSNRVPDAWEAANLGGLGGDLSADPDGDGIPTGLEYVYGTLPAASSSDPREINLRESGRIRLVFPRRAGLASVFYRFESAPDLHTWATALNVTETVHASQVINGVTIEMVEALIPSLDSGSGFVRLVWLP